MKKLMLMMFCLLAGIMCAKAQIGYQISLLNTATGEPRANETVTVTIKLSNNVGEVFYSETKSATTNDFGVLSLSIGNADTFKDVDLTKMPFYIEATANGVMIGKSQILSVPVAEIAKQLSPAIDLNELVGIWKTDNHPWYGSSYSLTFYKNGTGKYAYYDGEGGSASRNFVYTIEGKNIYINVITMSDFDIAIISDKHSHIFDPFDICNFYNGKLVSILYHLSYRKQ